MGTNDTLIAAIFALTGAIVFLLGYCIWLNQYCNNIENIRHETTLDMLDSLKKAWQTFQWMQDKIERLEKRISELENQTQA